MQLDNLVLSVVCGAGVVLAAVIAWRGRRLPMAARHPDDLAAASASAAEATRRLAAALAAGAAAGFLVVGLGGRLVMRAAAVTSGVGAGGRLTDAGEIVGEITFNGSAAVAVFVGLLPGALFGMMSLVVRWMLPGVAWQAGLVVAVLLAATFGVADPLSPDNIDFTLLTPLPVVIGMVLALGLLFGLTFAALLARLDGAVPRLWASSERRRRPGTVAYASLLLLVFPFGLLLGVLYVLGRVAARGRVGAVLDGSSFSRVARAGTVLAAGLAAVVVTGVTADILG